MKGSKLSVKSVIVSVPKREIYTTAKCLEKVGIEVVDVIVPSIGTYWAHKNVSTDTETGIVIDLGYDTTKISVFNKGIIVNNLVIGVGGKNVDNDISFIYKVTKEQAVELKKKLALANKKNARESEKTTLVNTLGQKITINQKELTEVVMSRLREILNMAKNEINYLTKKEISYIIISGGLSETRDFPLEVESVFGTKANAGKIMVVGARSNEYATAIGMIKFFDYKLKLRDRDFSTFTQDEIDIICGGGEKRINLGDSVLGKVFGIFFDN
jgi:cell division protein FtsA